MKRRIMLRDKKPDVNTLLLLHAEDFTDNSTYKRSITNYSNYVALDNNGKWSKCFNTNKQYARLQVDSILLPSTNFSIEAWIFSNSYSQTKTIFSNGTGSLEIGVDAGKLRCVKEYVSLIALSNNIIPVSKWNHIYVEVFSNILKAYLNGTIQFTKQVQLNKGTGLYIGNQKEEPNRYYFNGNMDEIRISDIQRWTSNFTPPTKPY